jgi:uncharacterized protein YidB (DUF937 family)
MDFNELFRMGAELIQNNSDDATTGLDLGDIANALGGLLQDGEGGLDLSTFVSQLSENGLGEIVGSWLGNGENAPIDAEQISALLGSEKVSQFASQLGLEEGSALQALADALPNVIDQATSGDGNIVEQMLGGSNPMDMLGKMFG